MCLRFVVIRPLNNLHVPTKNTMQHRLRRSPRDQPHHPEQEVILNQGSRLPKRDHPVPWTFFKTRTAAHLPHLGNQDQPGPARSSRVARPSGPSAWTPIRPVGPARHPPSRSLGHPQKTRYSRLYAATRIDRWPMFASSKLRLMARWHLHHVRSAATAWES